MLFENARYSANFFPLSDIMDLRHQSCAMCIIMLGGEDTPVVCNGWAEIGRRNGIENQSQFSGRHTKFLNGIETTRIEVLIFGEQIALPPIEFSRKYKTCLEYVPISSSAPRKFPTC